MAKQIINLGTTANDDTGDTIRDGGDKINDNFTEIYSKIIDGNFVIVKTLADLPAPVADVITLAASTTYRITDHIDLLGDRLVLSAGTVIFGTSSTNASITSTGKVSGALFKSDYHVEISDIKIFDDNEVFDFDGNGTTDNCFLNNLLVQNCTSLGTIKNYAAVLSNQSTYINNGTLTFDQTIGTIGCDTSLFAPASGAISINVPATCTITRRIRLILCGWIINGSAVGVNVDVGATITDESYLLESNSFTGTSVTYLTGLDYTSNKALFVENKGITNTAVHGEMYMNNNATATTVGVINTWYKAAGTTTAGNNSKYLHASNKLTCDASIERKYTVICTLAFSSSANNVCRFGFYDSEDAVVVPATMVKSTANSGGNAENVSVIGLIHHSQGGFIELHVMNTTGANNITVTDMHMIITEIK